MFGVMLVGEVKKNVFNVCIYNYKIVREKVLSNNYILENVYDNLVKIVYKYLLLLYRYIELCKELLGLDDLKMYDLYILLIKDIKFEMFYEEVKEWMLKVLELMGEEYLNVVKEGLNNCWVDVYENKGKCLGGYLLGVYLINLFILFNWFNIILDLYILVYEFGYLVYSYFSRKF